MADVFNIAGRIHSTSQEEVVTGTNEILDETQGKKQSEVNQDVNEELALHTNRINALTAQNYVTVQATQSTTAADIPTLINATGDGEQTDTIYRVGFWDGSEFDGTKYSEYAWDGTSYVQLNVRTGSLDGVFDISEYNTSGGSPAVYDNLTQALADVPLDVQRGGMSVKYIQRIPAMYSVVVTQSDTQPTGTALVSASSVTTGTYDASALTDFSTLPSSTGAGNAVVYYYTDGSTYTIWTITMASAESAEYVQYRLMATQWTNTVSDWQGVDAVPTAGSKNLVESVGVYDAIKKGCVYNISELHPTEGVNGGNTYYATGTGNAFSKIPNGRRVKGMLASFINADTGEYELYQHKGGNINILGRIEEWNKISPYKVYNFFTEESDLTKSYSNGLLSFYVDRQYLSPTIRVSAQCNNSKLSVFYDGASIIYRMDFSVIENGNPIDLVATINETPTTIGKIIFKDKTAWVNNPTPVAPTLRNEVISNPNQLGLFEIKNGSITHDMLGDNSVESNNIQDGSISHSKLANDAVESGNIKNGAVTDAKIDAGAVAKKTRFYISDPVEFTKIPYYESALQSIWLNPEYFTDISDNYICAKNYSSSFRLYIGTSNFFQKPLSEINNNKKIAITRDINGLVTEVGYVIFRDKSQWNADGNDVKYPQLDKEIVMTNPIYHKAEVADIDRLQEEIDMITPQHNNLHITIPNIVYAVVGTELNLYNDTITLSADDGLTSPKNYQVKWICSKGLVTQRCFRYIPDAADAGKNYTCTCYLYDLNFNLLEQKDFTIKVLAKNALSSHKNIAFFGASSGPQTCTQCNNDFSNTDKFSGTVPTTVGTRGTTYKYDCVGGYGWKDYATEGRHAYRIYVTGVTSLEIDAKYTLTSGTEVKIREVNIDEGTGNVLIEASYGAAIANFPTSDTLTKVSGGGDGTITYDNTGHEDGGEQPNNPLWNSSTGSLDVALYKEKCGMQQSDIIDAVYFGFGINDHALADDLSTLNTYISDLYTAFIADNQNCKFIIGMMACGNNDLDGAGANYGATFNTTKFKTDLYAIQQFYLSLQGNANYPNIVICPLGLEIDRYYGYAFADRPISQRYPTNERAHINFLHPGTSGYGQLGDSCFATYIGALIQ